MNNSRLSNLYQRYLAGQCSNEEIEELAYYFNSPLHESELKELMGETWQNLTPEQILFMDNQRSDDVLKNILDQKRAKGWNIYRKLAIAASILVVLAGSLMFILRTEYKSVTVAAALTDIRPASVKATLTLGNGKQIELDSALTGKLARESGTSVTKEASGKLVYIPERGQNASETVINTLNIPRGAKFQVVLADQTIVYLNAGSSLSFPSAFNGNERRVTLKGEAYFEVAKDPQRPFKVNVNNKQTIEVLGTHFNVKAYEDEEAITTTLAEGSVRVTAANRVVVLKPGQAAINDRKELLTQKANIYIALAWQKGLFVFDNENIVSIMKKLEKWYDIDVEFEGNMHNINILGNYSRDKSLNGLLKTFAATKKLAFKLEGRRLTVIAK